MKNYIIYLLILTLSIVNSTAQNWCSQPNPNFCPGNIVSNGDFENITGDPNTRGDLDIGLAVDWLNLQNGLTSDLACGGTVHVPLSTWFVTPPSPNTGVYAGMWIQNNTDTTTNAGHREVMYNQLNTTIPNGSINYNLTFDIAKGMDNAPNHPGVIGIYGVLNTSNLPTDLITGLYNPLNVNLWATKPSVQVVKLGSIVVPTTLTNNWQPQSITFNSSILPAAGITHLLITSDDITVTTNSRIYINFDNFCLQPSPCCPESLKLQLAPSHNGPINVPNGAPWSQGIPLSVTEETLTVTNPNVVPITEVKVNIVDFEFTNPIEACADCINNPGHWASLGHRSTPYQNIGSGAGSPLTATPGYTAVLGNRFNDREIVWQSNTGKLLNSGDVISFNLLLPAFSKIPCCVAEVEVCYKVTYKYADCTQCEEEICTQYKLE